MFDADDIAAFNDTDLPGYALATIGGAPVPGRFRAAYAEALGISGSKPMFAAASSDLAAVIEGTAVEVDASSYTVAEIQPGDLGQTRLILEAA